MHKEQQRDTDTMGRGGQGQGVLGAAAFGAEIPR